MIQKNFFPNWSVLNSDDKEVVMGRFMVCFPESRDNDLEDNEYYNNVLEEAARKYISGDTTWVEFKEG